MKTIKITPSVKSKIKMFLYGSDLEKVSTLKLSDLYNSRSTNYHSCYDSDLFVIDRSESSIVLAGYSKRCKAIINLNLKNEGVAKIVKELRSENAIEKAKKEADAALFTQQVEEAKKWISENAEIVEKEARKVCAKFQREFSDLKSMNSKMLQQLSWFLLKNFKNNTKTAIYHAL